MNYLKIEIQNGYWQLNEKPVKNCSYAKKCFFDKLLTMRKVKEPITVNNTFKHRASQVKSLFNYEFRINLKK